MIVLPRFNNPPLSYGIAFKGIVGEGDRFNGLLRVSMFTDMFCYGGTGSENSFGKSYID